MADKINTGKVAHSVPSSPVVQNVQIKPFLHKTPIPSIEKETKWVQGAPTPIQEGQLTPISEALNLLVGFSSGEVFMEGEELKHIPSISESLASIWDTPKRKNTDGRANRTKKAKIAQKEPHKNISKQLAILNPHTKVPNSEIQIENIIQDSPSSVPYKVNTLPGKGKGVKNIKLNVAGSASEMARTKTTLTAKQRSTWASKAAQAAKNAIPKPQQTTSMGKAPWKQQATKAAHKQENGQGVKTKPRQNYAMITLCEIRHFQRSVDLLIPLLRFQ